MSEEALKKFRFQSKMTEGTTAESAVAAGSSGQAGQQQRMAEPGNSESFFTMCDQTQLDKIKSAGQQRLNILINNNADDFYKLPEGIAKNDLTGKKLGTIAGAMGDLTDHMLGFIIPGQVMMLEKEDKLERDMSQVKTELGKILQQLSYYAEDNRRMAKTIKDMADSRAENDRVHTNVIKELQNDVHKSKEEIVKLRNELFLNKETDRGQRPENSAQNDQSQGDQGQGRGRGGRGRGRGGRGRYYWGPNGSQPHPYPADIAHVPGSGADFDPNSTSNKYFTDNQGRTPSQRREQAEKDKVNAKNNDEGGWYDDITEGPSNPKDNNKKRVQNKNKNKKPETVPLTKKQMRYAKEVIIHKVPSQKKGSYKDEDEYRARESDILYELFDDISPKYLKDHGVTIDIKKDIDYSDSFMKHYDELHHGLAPIRLRFHTVKMCNQVIKAAKRAECLNGRRPSFFGKHAIPRKYDNSGNLNANADEEAKRIAASRPAFYFRPSLPKEDRLKKEAERKEREEKKNDPETIKFREQRQENLGYRVKFGKSRNFGKSDADIASEKAVQEKEKRLKEIREKKAEKEKERMENLKVTNKNFPNMGNGPSVNQLASLKIQTDQNVDSDKETLGESYESAKSSNSADKVNPEVAA